MNEGMPQIVLCWTYICCRCDQCLGGVVIGAEIELRCKFFWRCGLLPLLGSLSHDLSVKHESKIWCHCTLSHILFLIFKPAFEHLTGGETTHTNRMERPYGLLIHAAMAPDLTLVLLTWIVCSLYSPSSASSPLFSALRQSCSLWVRPPIGRLRILLAPLSRPRFAEERESVLEVQEKMGGQSRSRARAAALSRFRDGQDHDLWSWSSRSPLVISIFWVI